MNRWPAIAGVALGLGLLSGGGVFLVRLNYYDERAATPWWFDAWGVLTWGLLGTGIIALVVTVAVVVVEAVRGR